MSWLFFYGWILILLKMTSKYKMEYDHELIGKKQIFLLGTWKSSISQKHISTKSHLLNLNTKHWKPLKSIEKQHSQSSIEIHSSNTKKVQTKQINLKAIFGYKKHTNITEITQNTVSHKISIFFFSLSFMFVNSF